TLHALKRYEEALADKTKAVELEPGNAGYYDSRGTTLHKMGRYEEALTDATKAIELEPGNAGYYDSRGVTLHALKRYEEALADKTKAVELEPGNAGYYDSRGTTLHKMGRYEEALTDATKAIELEPGNAGYYDSRAITYFRMKDYLKALIDAKKAYSIDSLDLEFKYDLARVLYFSGLPEDAFEYIREIPKKCNYASAFRTRALTKIRLKHCNEEEVTEDFVKEVTADLEHAIELDTENVNSFIDFAIAMLLLEKPKEVIEKLEAARKIDPEEPEVYHWYAEYYRKTGDAQKAAEYDRIADEKGYIPEPDDT
ncbi:MAG TPA: tetratricopeptide repeat protein, partial [Eubacteriales bacterium]|nr:tetratricopeptide repeat protein [Eubacteriales bacterium]